MILGIHPYILTDGDGREAVEFYQEAIDAQVMQIQTFGDMPANSDFPIPDEMKQRIINAHLKVGDTDLMISDTFTGQTLPIGDQVTISLATNDIDKTREVFTKLQEEGQVLMALEETFWSPLYGQVKDKFGVTWQITTVIDPS
ncbi:VOC family protein [Shimazuella alba]|uniref:VOC family protein n=1 Tax=Shimazuella alba TaxID=2690964 RepID=A0A6I4VR64_9BACL|nr:VOC family protein [Shimazuella alba]MXQ52901.1 VOC family protein [Shimazuella alba]